MKQFLLRFRSAKYANWLLLCVFAGGGVFLQCVLFNWLACHSIPVSSLWRNPLYFFSFYLPKLAIALLFGSFVFLFRRKYWIIYASVLIDVWIWAEILYCRANRILISAHTFTLIGYLDGFWSSIPTYFKAEDMLLLIPLVIVVVGVILFDNRERSYLATIILMVISVLLSFCGGCVFDANKAHEYRREYTIHDIHFSNPFSEKTMLKYGCHLSWYTAETSVIHAFVYDVKELLELPFRSSYHLTDSEKKDAERFVEINSDMEISPKHPLVLVLVESLEDWAVRPDVMPNLYRFIETHNVVYAQRVKSQTKGGTSGDGQMIYNTGLLPIFDGAVCASYSQNVFPSLSEVYSSSAIIVPGDLEVWNQREMSAAYCIDTNYVNPKGYDHITFSTLDNIYSMYSYVMAITIATHSPFEKYRSFSSLQLPEDMPTKMRNYLLCMNYTDSCWGNFLQRIDTDSVLHNSVVCFMGDHIIFDAIMRKEFQDYSDRAGLDYQPQEAYTAFVAYSPDLTEKNIINEVTYQMDAYPTIRHLIGADTYYWKGFGIDLSDTTHTMVRPITEQDAYIVSDKIIRANYFKEYLGR